MQFYIGGVTSVLVVVGVVVVMLFSLETRLLFSTIMLIMIKLKDTATPFFSYLLWILVAENS